jgi:hypothetical protein
MQNLKNGDGSFQTIEATPGILPDALATEIPDIEYAASVVPAAWFQKKGIISTDNSAIKAGAQFISKDYFHLFSLSFIAGDPKKVLLNKNSIAISENLATRLFRTTNNVIGKMVEWKQGQFDGLYQIAGVFKSPPTSATQQFDILFNYSLFLEKRPFLRQWGNSDPTTYVLVRKGTDIKQLNEKLKQFLTSKEKGISNTLFLQRYSDRYLYGYYENGTVAGGRITYVKLFLPLPSLF